MKELKERKYTTISMNKNVVDEVVKIIKDDFHYAGVTDFIRKATIEKIDDIKIKEGI